MGKHTSERTGIRVEAEETVPGESLQPERAFVVQLRGRPAASPSRLQGRVEHVVSGEALRFGSTEELIEFLARGQFPGSTSGSGR